MRNCPLAAFGVDYPAWRVFMDNVFERCREEGRVLVFGHRGYSQLYPENTMVSFDNCAKHPNVDGVELDVHLCRTGEVVVAHDFSLKRTAGIDREIEELSWDELRAIDVGSFKGEGFSDARIPLLEELLGTYGSRFVYDIELKVKAGKVNPELCRRTLDVIRRCNVEDSVLVSSFNPFALRRFGSICRRRIPRADIFCHAQDVPRILWDGAGHIVSRSSYLKPEYKQVDAAYLDRVPGRPVVCWTVNSSEDARRLLSLNEGGKGMRVYGLIGNDPCLLADAVEAHGNESLKGR